MPDTYRVQLDVYAGPLDLLLYLVRRQELDIGQLPIARITHQFLEMMEVLQLLDLDEIGEFVVMASTLIEIKSRQVLPEHEEANQPAEAVEINQDPRAELVAQLLEYKRYRDASVNLEEHAAEWQLRFPRLSDDAPRSGTDPSQDLIKEVELWDLVSALSRVIHQNTPQAPKSIIYDDTPITVYSERIRERVLAENRVAFTSFFEGATHKTKIIGIFLAMLELLRHYKFRAEQAEEYGEIWILPPAPQVDVESADELTGVPCAKEVVTEPTTEAMAPTETTDAEITNALPESMETATETGEEDISESEASTEKSAKDVPSKSSTETEASHGDED